LFLASTSPRRAQLLHTAGIPFTIAASLFDEPPPTAQDDRTPARYVERLARDFARRVLTTILEGF
jgi:predicted house-cleaning NTP pyrophosphatase (Maf/HAM1 superfamily)